MNALEVTARGTPGPKSKLSSSGVGGVQMAEVAVDRETGIVRMCSQQNCCLTERC